MPDLATALFVCAGAAALGAVALGMRARRPAGEAEDDEDERPGPGEAPGSTKVRDGDIVAITGTVRAVGKPLIAPLSARTCVVYESYANLYESSAERHRALAGQLADRDMVPFELETSIGAVAVDGRIAELELSPTPVLPRRIEREVAFLRAHGREPALAHLSGFEEITIDPGALISVSGVVIIDDELDATARIRLVAHGDHALTIGPPRRIVVSKLGKL